MASFDQFKNIALLMLNFLFSFTISNYLNHEVHLIKSPVLSLKYFTVAYWLGYIILVVITSKNEYSGLQILSTPTHKNKGKFILTSILKWVSVVFLFHCLAILYGAALSTNVGETFSWAVLMSTLITLPCLQVEPSDILKTIAGVQESFTLPWCLFNNVVVLTLVGAWFGAFVIPLDWDRDWQVWPIPCSIGAMLGHFVGLTISGTLLYHQYRNRQKNKLV